MNILKLFSSKIINELERNNQQMEQKYNLIKKKEVKNRKLNANLRKLNMELNEELKVKKRKIKALYSHLTHENKEAYKEEVLRIEKDIGGKFAHRIRNMYEPVILINDKIYQEKTLLLDVNNLTPIEAINQLNEIKNEINEK